MVTIFVYTLFTSIFMFSAQQVVHWGCKCHIVWESYFLLRFSSHFVYLFRLAANTGMQTGGGGSPGSESPPPPPPKREGNNVQGCESSDFNLISDSCSSQNPIFRLLMHWKAHLFMHFRLFQNFFWQTLSHLWMWLGLQASDRLQLFFLFFSCLISYA